MCRVVILGLLKLNRENIPRKDIPKLFTANLSSIHVIALHLASWEVLYNMVKCYIAIKVC